MEGQTKEIPEGLREDDPLERFINYLARSLMGDGIDDPTPIMDRYVELDTENGGKGRSLEELQEVLFGGESSNDERYEQVDRLIQAIEEAFLEEEEATTEVLASLGQIAQTLEARGFGDQARRTDKLRDSLDSIALMWDRKTRIVGCPHGCKNLTSLIAALLTNRHPANRKRLAGRDGTDWLGTMCRRIHAGEMTADDLDKIIHDGLK